MGPQDMETPTAADNPALDSAGFAASFGFECIGRTCAHELQPIPEVRAMCAADLCAFFDKSWMCPPACGDIDVFAEGIKARGSVIVVQTVAELEDEFDGETIMAASALHDRRFRAYAAAIKAACPPDSKGTGTSGPQAQAYRDGTKTEGLQADAGLRERLSEALFLSAGACKACPQCTYPDRPCLKPDQAFVSMEAAGLLVSAVCESAGIPYYHGKGTIAFTSCVVY